MNPLFSKKILRIGLVIFQHTLIYSFNQTSSKRRNDSYMVVV